MDFLQSLLDNSSIPAITAFILGTLTAVSPCWKIQCKMPPKTKKILPPENIQ